MFYEYDMGIFVQNLVAVQLSFFFKEGNYQDCNS
jgi:hypothetical protein